MVGRIRVDDLGRCRTVQFGPDARPIADTRESSPMQDPGTSLKPSSAKHGTCPRPLVRRMRPYEPHNASGIRDKRHLAVLSRIPDTRPFAHAGAQTVKAR